MASTYTSNLALAKPGANDAGWGTTLNSDLALLDGQSALGTLAVKTAESPSTTLNVAVSAGDFRSGSGTIVSYAGTASFALTLSSTNYLYLTDAGVLTASTSAFPATGNIVRLATIVTGATTVTSVTDSRRLWPSLGGHIHWGVGSPAIAAGTGAGTSPTIAISGSDQAGLITITTGTSPATSATLATITFGAAFAATPRAVLLSPAAANSAALSGATTVYADSASLSTTVFLLKSGSSALTAATQYKWFYAVIG